MGKAAIVFIFPQPEENVEFGKILADCKEIFAHRDDVRVLAAIKDAAEQIEDMFEDRGQDESNLVKHARRELERCGNDDDFDSSIINAVKAFAKYGHSGGSASVAIPLLNELLQFHNITPLTDDPKEWNEVGDEMWQSARNSEAFSEDGGKTYRLVSEDEGIHISMRMHIPPQEDANRDLGGEG